MLGLALVSAGCGGADGVDAESGTTIVAAFYPLTYAAERVGGGSTRVRNLTPPGVEPHDLELSARDVRIIADADLVLYLGQGFQPALEDALDSADAPAVDLLEDLELLAGQAESEGRDPHVWLDPLRYAAIAERIAAELDRPDAASALNEDLRALDGEFRDGLADCERRELVTSHAAFGYLAERYDLEQVALSGLEPEAEPTPRELEQVVEEVREHDATTVFFETLVSPRLAETVAREVGARTATLNPLEGLTPAEAERGADYFSVMRANLVSLRKALECR
ncbi:MAG: zinc ABC transporter substrate-binding protein [Actinobacteria bacterium]|nr:zinc ABC transporter substrate-binding protein [Actinomycetota bacterium]